MISPLLGFSPCVAGKSALAVLGSRLVIPGIRAFFAPGNRASYSRIRASLFRGPPTFRQNFPAHSLTPAGDRICAPPRTIFLGKLNMFNPREEPGFSFWDIGEKWKR